jgi:arylsulfatase A-like enzyme
VRNYDLLEKEVNTDKITGQITAEAVQFIRNNKSKPFFLYLTHWMPHLALGASAKFKGKSKRGLYGDAVEEIDWSTGEILRTLQEEGLDSNTLVIFTSDNGPAKSTGEEGGSADPWVGGKFQSTEGGQRVPCVMRWPGRIPAGSVCSEVATAMDFFVTFAGLTGAQVPTDRVIDGKDILPLMTARKGAVSPYDECGFFYSNPTQKPVRRGKWKFGDNKLFDLSTVEQERRNVARQHPEIAAELKTLGEEKWKEIEKNFRPIGDLNPNARQKGPYERPGKPVKGPLGEGRTEDK